MLCYRILFSGPPPHGFACTMEIATLLEQSGCRISLQCSDMCDGLIDIREVNVIKNPESRLAIAQPVQLTARGESAALALAMGRDPFGR